jgi:DNA-binding response OmpR family regulator
MSGLDLVELLRRRREWKELPVIMLSSELADGTVVKAFQLGADDYTMKPVTNEGLEKAMETFIHQHVSTK